MFNAGVGVRNPPSPGIDDFPNVSPEEVAAALPTIRALGVPLLVHAELVDSDIPSGVSCAWLGRRVRM